MVIKKMIFNKYLLPAKTETGDLLLYNTLTYRMIRINAVDLTEFTSILQSCQRDIYFGEIVENIKVLADAGIFYEDESKIKQLLQERKNELFANKDTFTIIMLPTEQCNFRCAYCYENHCDGVMNSSTIDSICKLADKMLEKYKILCLNWFGGEPLLVPDMMEKITEKIRKICKKHKKPFYASITTNGFLLTENMMSRLLKMNVLSYQITVDGDRETHNKQRFLKNGEGTYDVILNNLLRIRDSVKTSTVHFSIRVNIANTFDSETIKPLREMFQSDKRFSISIHPIFESGKCEGTEYDKYLEEFPMGDLNISLSDLQATTAICYAAKNNSIMIRCNGDMGRCTVNLDDKKNKFGNINKVDIDSFAIDDLTYCHCEQSESVCENCPVYPICFGRQCPARKSQICDGIIKKDQILIQMLANNAEIISLKREN